MQVYREAAPMLGRVWARVTARVEAYPPALRELGRAFLSWAGPDYLSAPDAAPLLHLPLWLGRGVPSERLEALLEATTLAYAYVRIQDNVLDEPGGRAHPPLLLLGNALLWDALDGFRSLDDPRFWERARPAWLTFSALTELERRQVTADAPYSHADFVAHAQKCALAELPLYAVMAASGDWSGVEEVAPLVHLLARSYGCVNDVMGHARDLESGARTYLWSEVRTASSPPLPANAPPALLRAALPGSGVLDRLLEESRSTLMEAVPVAARLDIPPFPRFVAERSARLAELQLHLSLLQLGAALGA